jgi:hypothetical protein
MSVVEEMLAANRERPTIHQGMERPARKYEPASELLPWRRPHQIINIR